MAWHGQELLIEELLFNAPHGIVDQSLHSRMGAETTNGDGFGIGFYGEGQGPGRFRGIAPAWSDANLRDLAAHIESPLFIAHVRAASPGSPVQETNCHPFTDGQWLFVHNGYLGGFPQLRRQLMLHLDDEQFALVLGSTDSEVVFHLACTFGLHDDPIGALERTVGLIESFAAERGIPDAVQATFGVTDGDSIWAVRYATVGPARTLYVSADAASIQRLHPDNERFKRMTSDDRLVVSEPFSELPGVWEPIGEATAITVRDNGVLEQRPFVPTAV